MYQNLLQYGIPLIHSLQTGLPQGREPVFRLFRLEFDFGGFHPDSEIWRAGHTTFHTH